MCKKQDGDMENDAATTTILKSILRMSLSRAILGVCECKGEGGRVMIWSG